MRRWILSGKGEDPHKSSAIRKAPLDTKVSPFNDKVKKKKKLASRDATPMRAKSVVIEHSITAEASSSSQSKPKEETFTVVAEAESEPTPECSETAVVAACPTTVGNSKFRNRIRIGKSSSSGTETGDDARGTNLMRAAKTLPRSTAGIILDQVLAVSRGFLRTKYFKATSGKGGKLGTSGPKMLSNTRRQMVVVGTNPLFTRVPVHISYQTLNAETLLRKSPRWPRAEIIEVYPLLQSLAGVVRCPGRVHFCSTIHFVRETSPFRIALVLGLMSCMGSEYPSAWRSGGCVVFANSCRRGSVLQEF